MRFICAFENEKLLEIGWGLHNVHAPQFMKNSASKHGKELNQLSCVVFEDKEIKKYYNQNKKVEGKKIVFTREKLLLIDLVRGVKPIEVKLNWMNCTGEQIKEHYTAVQIQHITINKIYFESLGNEKYDPNFVFQWPYEIDEPLVTRAGKTITDVVYKEVIGIELNISE